MIISVASGKGGTGKTTVATNLAFVLGEGVQLLDCDVEQPNVHLFLSPELIIKSSEPAFAKIPKVDPNRCTYCKKCAQICRFKAIAVVGKNVLTFPELCHSCGGCSLVCPEQAISEAGRELGIIVQGRSGAIDFVHGKLRIGEAMSPPLIKQVRALANTEQIVIIDSPPGTSCPMIEAVKGTDFVLMVTEPTPFGLHDLKLAVEAVRVLGIPHGLVINRCNLGSDIVVTYAKTEKIPLLMEIPFERRIAQIYSRGELFSERLPEWKTAFSELYNRIEVLVNKGGPNA